MLYRLSNEAVRDILAELSHMYKLYLVLQPFEPSETH